MLKRFWPAATATVAALVIFASQPASAVPPPTLKVALYGDSLAQGLGSSDGQGLRTELTRLAAAAGTVIQWTASPSARGGWTVQDIRAGVDTWIPADRPDVIIVIAGTNNAAGVPPGMTNYRAAVDDLQARIRYLAPSATVWFAELQYSNTDWSSSLVWANMHNIQSSWAYGSGLIQFDEVPQCGWLYDGVHDRDAGYAAYARQTYRAMAPAYGWPSIPPDAFNPNPPRPGFERPATVAC